MENNDPKIAVVVPTYNERDNLPKIVENLGALPMPNLHVLVVDDDSPDGTGDVAEKLAIESPETIGVLHRSEKDGLGRAYVAGITRALDEGADIVMPSCSVPATCGVDPSRATGAGTARRCPRGRTSTSTPSSACA
ncbi:hypothetical protein GCM10009835_42680 [Planosporangium flavigriseum]|uniref:Glycosyltransferase 2-like domain-containing protein n=1 Tax=Planosporangium flavigriseum TaxID=373681 RepID=A0A8J3LZ44_9ACTN|nr:hypothetical protein Pfl04_48230 [Planosporangium flavigriseum]